MLSENYYNEWLSEPSLSWVALEAFLAKNYKRALTEEKERESNLTIGSRVHAIMNAMCIGLELKGLISDHMIRWGEDWMELSFIMPNYPHAILLKFDLQ